MKASSLTHNSAFDLVFPLVTPRIHILPIQLNQDNRRTKDELMSRKLKKKSISPLKFLNLKFFSRLNRFILIINNLFTFWMLMYANVSVKTRL